MKQPVRVAPPSTIPDEWMICICLNGVQRSRCCK